MRSFVHFIPIATTLVAGIFSVVVLRRAYLRRSGPHLVWWGIGILMYGVGTFTESWVTIFGWNETAFRLWYVSGALLGGAPLAQGTVYLLLQRRVANVLSVLLLSVVSVAAVFVFLTPINYEVVEIHRLTGAVIQWTRVRLFSPVINIYAFIFLVGGAVWSALKYRKDPMGHNRFLGNVFIAVGALLPGIGGTATRFGYTEVLYVTEFLGLLLIWVGYWWNVRESPVPKRDSVAA
jgi:hypothetical protein